MSEFFKQWSIAKERAAQKVVSADKILTYINEHPDVQTFLELLEEEEAKN